MALAIKHVHLS